MIIKDLKIEKPVYGGYGLGYSDGKVIFVEKAIPGDTVDTELYSEKKSHAFGRILALKEPSPRRVQSPCPVFSECGGCSYLITDYENELKLKHDILMDALKRTAGMADEDLPVINTVSGPRIHYRSHAGIKTDGRAAGFFRRGTNELCPFPSVGCLLLSENLMKAKPSGIKGSFRAAADPAGNLFTDPEQILTEQENGIQYRRRTDNFFQANRFLRGKMQQIAGEYAALVPGMKFLDIACGTGFFTLYLARSGAAGHGVDINKSSIKMAEQNAVLNGIKNVSFEAKDGAEIHPFREHYDVVIADPPRAGLDKRTRRTINAMRPDRFIYISCNPSTFARDLKDFISAGYFLKKLTLIDMFPCTMHIETVCLLSKLNEAKHRITVE